MRIKFKRSKRWWVIVVVATVIVIGGLLIFNNRHSTQTAPPGIKNVVTNSTAKPSEKPLTTSNYSSTAAADEPASISLPTIKAQGFIQKVGIDQYGQVAAPNNIYLAGWYVNSLKPGQPGLSIIDGHVDGLTAIGIFYRLSKLKPGDTFLVTFGDGSSKTFQVKSLAQVAVADVPSVLFARDNSINSQLNLITCGGVFDRSSHSYLSRTIVVSALI